MIKISLKFEIKCKCGQILRARPIDENTIMVDPCEKCLGVEREKTADSILKTLKPFNI